MSDWTNLAIVASAAIGGAAIILRTLSGPVTFAGHCRRLGEISVFDGLLSFGWKRFAKPERLQVAVYVTVRKTPAEPQASSGDANDRAAPLCGQNDQTTPRSTSRHRE